MALKMALEMAPEMAGKMAHEKDSVFERADATAHGVHVLLTLAVVRRVHQPLDQLVLDVRLRGKSADQLHAGGLQRLAQRRAATRRGAHCKRETFTFHHTPASVARTRGAHAGGARASPIAQQCTGIGTVVGMWRCRNAMVQ